MHKHGMGRMYRDCLEVWGGLPKNIYIYIYLFCFYYFGFFFLISASTLVLSPGSVQLEARQWAVMTGVNPIGIFLTNDTNGTMQHVYV